jgi:hypothetical protein
MDKITRSAKRLIFEKRVHPVFRFIVFLVSFFPLLAPYELLVKIRWAGYFNLPFLVSLLFSTIATAFSLFIMFIAFFAQNQYACFELDKATLTYGWSDAVRAYRETVYRFEELSVPELVTHPWSDGPTTYNILVKTRTGAKISFGDFESKGDAQQYRTSLTEIISSSDFKHSNFVPDAAPGGHSVYIIYQHVRVRHFRHFEVDRRWTIDNGPWSIVSGLP